MCVVMGAWLAVSPCDATEAAGAATRVKRAVTGALGIPDLSEGPVSFVPTVPPEIEVRRVKTGHLLVRPTINGRESGWFIFDTGAGINVISTPHVSDYALTPSGSLTAKGVGGNEESKLFRAARLVLGPMTMHDQPLMATDLSFLKSHLGEEIVGVIGFGVLARCVAEVDLATPSIRLHDPARFSLPDGATWSEMSLEARVPSVKARFEGREGRFRLDTGANDGLVFHAPAVRRWRLLENREVSDAKVGGVGGFVPVKRGEVAWVELGGVRHEHVSARFATQPDKGTFAKKKLAGNIGAGLLKHYVLVLDYASERIAFMPNTSSRS